MMSFRSLNSAGCITRVMSLTGITTEAVELFARAAQRGHVDAQSKLGWMFTIGKSVPRNNLVALTWLRRASERGDAEAQHRRGQDVQISGKELLKAMSQRTPMFSMADAKGHKASRKARHKLARKMTPSQLAESQRRAREWQSKTKAGKLQ